MVSSGIDLSHCLQASPLQASPHLNTEESDLVQFINPLAATDMFLYILIFMI